MLRGLGEGVEFQGVGQTESWAGGGDCGVPVEVTGMCLGRSQCSNLFCVCRSAGPAVIRVLMDCSVGTL